MNITIDFPNYRWQSPIKPLRWYRNKIFGNGHLAFKWPQVDLATVRTVGQNGYQQEHLKLDQDCLMIWLIIMLSIEMEY